MKFTGNVIVNILVGLVPDFALCWLYMKFVDFKTALHRYARYAGDLGFYGRNQV